MKSDQSTLILLAISIRGLKMEKSKEKIGDMIVTATQMAALLGVSKRTIRDYAERGLLERTPEGAYRVSSVRTYFSHLQSQAEKTAPEAGLAAARAGLAKVRTQEAELRMDAFRHVYVSTSDVLERWSQIAEIVRDQVLGLAERVSSKLPHLTAHDRAEIATLNREMLEAVAEEADALGARYIQSTHFA